MAGPGAARVAPGHPRQGAVGLLLAAAIIGAWLAVHVYGVFFFPWSVATAPLALALVAVETWLGAGMFIVAHDAMHGSLAPGRPRLERLIGQVALGIYAAFDFGKLNAKHHDHHRTPGAEGDPDFHVAGPTLFWRWYLQFFTTYFGWWEMARLTAAVGVYVLILKAPLVNMLVFWALPAILSSLQLFAFGTWLPHRHAEPGFPRPSQRPHPGLWLAGLALHLLPLRPAPRAPPAAGRPVVAVARRAPGAGSRGRGRVSGHSTPRNGMRRGRRQPPSAVWNGLSIRRRCPASH